jgi:spore coat polysaccharide biosynthesis protein SpsF
MNIVAIVQARLGSSRLPGKSVMRIQGNPMIWHVLNRVRQAKRVTRVVLAIPAEKGNALLLNTAADLKVLPLQWEGDPNDLIGRYNYAAWLCEADLIVRVPGDNPCVDPDEIDRIIALQQEQDWHWLTSNLDRNIHRNGYPGGLGAEVYTRSFLDWLNRNVECPLLREHPHLWAFANEKVLTCKCPPEFAYPHMRFDVNTLEDFQRIDSIYATAPTNFRSKDLV